MAIKRVALQAATANLTQNQPITVDVDGFLISAGLLTYAYLQNVSATDKILGRASAGAGVIEEIACTAAGRAILDDANAAAQLATLGINPLPIASGGTNAITAAAAIVALGVVDSNNRMPKAMMPTKVLNSYWHASNDEKTVVAGTWTVSADGSQTDYDPSISATAGYVVNDTGTANNDEIHFGSLTLTRGTYKISFSTVTRSICGIMEILHGTTSLGTFDGYSAGIIFNVANSFTYTPTTTATGNLRVKVTGKNGSSSNYFILLSRLEIIRTG